MSKKTPTKKIDQPHKGGTRTIKNEKPKPPARVQKQYKPRKGGSRTIKPASRTAGKK